MPFPEGQAGCIEAMLSATLPRGPPTESQMNSVLGPPKVASGQAAASPSGWIPSTRERNYFRALGEGNTARLQAEVGYISWTLWGRSLSLFCFPA